MVQLKNVRNMDECAHESIGNAHLSLSGIRTSASRGGEEAGAANNTRVKSYGDREESASCADNIAVTLQISYTSG